MNNSKTHKSKWCDILLLSGERKQKEAEKAQEKLSERDPNHTTSSDRRQQTWGETSSHAKSSSICSVSSTLLQPLTFHNHCSSPYSHPICTPTVNPTSQPPPPQSLSYPSAEKIIFFLVSTLFQANTTLPQTSPCLLSPPNDICTNPSWFWHSYLTFLIILQCISVYRSRFP